MTKKQALKEFREDIMPIIRENERQYTNTPDISLRRQEWGYFVESLYRDQRISKRQVYNWDNPF